MKSFILLLCFVNSYSFYLHMNNMKNTNWNSFQFTLKEQARKWFIDRAISSGIPWDKLYKKYDDVYEDINTFRYVKEDKMIIYPDYYTRPFHGYDEGNLNWLAAKEGDAATLSIAAGYWPKEDPYVAQEWMRQNITQNIKKYIDELGVYPKQYPKSALDMGCSIGISTEYLQNCFPKSKIDGIDLSPYFIAVAAYRNTEHKLGINYIHGNIEKTTLRDNSYDFIISNFVFHELPCDAANNVLNEIKRLLTPGGIVAIIDMDPSNLDKQLKNNIFRKWAFESTEPHIYDYYLRDTCDMLKENGFEYITKRRNDPLNSIWLGVKSSKNYLSKNVLSDRFNEPLESEDNSQTMDFSDKYKIEDFLLETPRAKYIPII